jgi:hypothetical protein
MERCGAPHIRDRVRTRSALVLEEGGRGHVGSQEWWSSLNSGVPRPAVISSALRIPLPTKLAAIPRTSSSAYCALIFAARMTFPHFSVSSAMNFPNSAGVIGIGEEARSARRVLKFGSARAASISRLSLSMIAGAVFLGAPRPCHQSCCCRSGSSPQCAGRQPD